MDPYSYIPVPCVPYGVEIPNRVFVGGISYTTTELELKEFFGQFGQVKDSKIITDRSGVSKGYGFITFETEEEAAKVYTKGSLFYKQKKLNVSKAVRKQGGQYSKANQEYVNGQHAIWLHPSGYLVSQHDGAWHFEQPNPHTQPTKPCYSVYSPVYLAGNQPHYVQSPTTVPALPAPAEVYSPRYYPALPAPSSSCTYITEPPSHQQHPPPSYPPSQPATNQQQALDGTGTLQSSQSSVTENRTEENKGAEDVGDTSKDMAFLENQTKQLTLDSPDKDNQKKAVNNPVSIPSGIVRKTGHGSPFQSRKPPRFQTHRPPNLSRPSHLLSPTCQPNFHYTYPPPSHQYPMGPGITYTNTLPPTLQPQHYALNPISNISTAAFTSPPISPNIVSL